MSDRDPGPSTGIASPADVSGAPHPGVERQGPVASFEPVAARQPASGTTQGRPLPSSFPWLALAATALIALGLLWLAAEQHYQGCLQAVEARSGSSSLDRLVRQEQVDACSRLPF